MSKRLLTHQKCISLSEAEDAAIEIASGFLGMSQSGYIRQAVIEKLVAQQFMQHPMADKLAAMQAAKAKA